MAIFTGAGVAIITPFHEDGSVNYNKLEELIDFQCNNGTDSIVICGTTPMSARICGSIGMMTLPVTIITAGWSARAMTGT